MPITLTPELEIIVRERLTFGDYNDEHAVLEAAFQELMYREIVKPEDEPIIRASIEEGLARVEQDDVVTVSDKGSFVDRATERLEERHQPSSWEVIPSE